LVAEQLNEGWWKHHDEFPPVAAGGTAVSAHRGKPVTGGPIAVPELVPDAPGHDRPHGSASALHGNPTPAWWTAFDGPRFAQPDSAPGVHASPGASVRPLRVPELDVAPMAPWPAPAPPGADPPDGWWLASDGQWYPPTPTSEDGARPERARAFRRPQRLLRPLAALGTACAVVGIGFVVGTALSPTPGPEAPTSAPTTSSPAASPSSVPTTTTPPSTEPPAGSSGPAGTTSTPGATPSPAQAPSSTPAPTPAPTPQATSGVVYEYEHSTTPTTVAQLATDPTATAGSRVAFTGVIVAFATDSSGGATAMYVSTPGAPSQVVLVQLSPYDEVTRITTGDTVVIWGDATGRVIYENTVGQPTEVTNVDQVYLSDETSGYQDTGDPAPA